MYTINHCLFSKMSFLLVVAVTAEAVADPASNQLINFKNKTFGPIGIMTTSNGAPIEIMDTDALNSPLINNVFFMESMSHLVRERIPERVVHAKGAGAFGYFQVTHNVTDICKANLFSQVGKKTPIVVRFSLATSDKGAADTIIDPKGFSIKFFTEEGNFDIVGFHTPMIMLKDPNMFLPAVRALKRNPVTNLKDPNMLWDFLTLRPETMFFFLYLFGDNGIPDGYRYMPGFSIHTYQVYNKQGESYFVRFHMLPDLGIRNIVNIEDAIKLAGTDPDYAIKDLYNAIEKGNFPSWTISVQVLSSKDVKESNFDVFDLTKVLPLSKYPLRPLGKFVLNKNPSNFFAVVEQLAFCPSNLVPGILGAPDKAFEARRFAYRDAQLYRLGANFNKILVNCPLRNIMTYDRDGVAPVGYNGGGSPNYFTNSYHGPVPYIEKNRPSLIRVTHDNSNSFDQAADLYTNEMTAEARSRMIAKIVSSLGQTYRNIQQRAIKIFYEIHPDLGYRVKEGLARSNA